ncbi:MAG TPA: sigma-54 dependent transcriptional regulator, partial [Candidatus Angelobacter sp.]|nr:sigma-54 dependent transcriptional regulator [Candidatus Angelobacter sp.]
MSELAILNRPPVEAAGSGSILIIDDEAGIRESLETLLEFEGYSVASAETGEEGLTKIGERPFDLVLLDFALPDRNGLEILADIRSRDPQLAVIMITAYGTVDNAVRVIQNGAANFIQKPWDNEKLLADVRAVVARRRAEQENEQLRRALHKFTFENIVGKSEPMLRVFDLVSQVAPSRSTVLIQGESGTGKELIAKALHSHSPRKNRTFVPVNTGSMPADLLESTLFGHVKGAFTSAVSSKKGLFEVADGGTIFLDEIGAMGLETQAKILRVLQDRKFMHL